MVVELRDEPEFSNDFVQIGDTFVNKTEEQEEIEIEEFCWGGWLGWSCGRTPPAPPPPGLFRPGLQRSQSSPLAS